MTIFQSIRKTAPVDFPMSIYTKRLLIRPVMSEDSPFVNEGVIESLPELSKWFLWAARAPTLEETESAIRQFCNDHLEKKELNLVIISENELIGMANYSFNWKIPSGEIAYWGRTRFTGRGLMREAISALTIYGFRQMGLKKLTIVCDDENRRSRTIPEKLGYEIERHARGLVPKPGDSTLRLCSEYARFTDEGLDDSAVTWIKESCHPPLIS